MSQPGKLGRIAELQRRLGRAGLDAALINLSRDVFYYTGTAQPSLLALTQKDYRLLVRRAPDFVRRETFLPGDRLADGAGLGQALGHLREMGVGSGRLGLELDAVPATLYLKMARAFAGFELADVSPQVLQQRMRKDPEEIEAIRRACGIMHAGHLRTLETLRPGMTELELAAEVEYAHRRGGHEGVLSMRNFDFYISRGPLSSGANLLEVSGFADTVTGVGLSPAVPAGPSHRVMAAGEVVIVDIPTCYQGYHCDQTRTYCLGEPRPQVRELFAKLLAVSDRTMDRLRAGVTCGELFEASLAAAREQGVEELFLGLEPRKGNFVGHGIGLDANEPPILSQGSDFPLLQDYALTIELHLTHPEHGAVKLEDVVLVTEDGCRMLSQTPRELFVVPA